eukprot:NODE_2474_length_1166_cov_44.652551_g2358_i0.p1 GENE.NODE_2474_length_1166_cov_44.652551_g2358_i0~~NODE_2474_length_1166_cov_44.652551_g2358_i0.p1  ORF type:complete len:360 (+),score=20.34 NODE_2474_length_1166_cov_44.652551_g2358_i0:1-1080(+)
MMGTQDDISSNICRQAFIPYLWTKVQVEGQIPCPRRGHTAIIWRDKMILFGGCGNRKISNSVFEYEFNVRVWRRVDCFGDVPSKRYGHTAVGHQDRMIVFGGFKNNGSGFDDTMLLDLPTKHWKQLQFPIETIPHRRGGHTASLHEGRMLMFGGSHKDSSVTSLDLGELRWSVLECHGHRPQGRFYHSATVVKDSLYIFGGCWGSKWELRPTKNFFDVMELNLQCNMWSKLECGGRIPHAISRHTAVSYGSKLILFGGKSDTSLYNDIWTLDLVTREWEKPPTDGPPPAPRYRHSCVVFDQSMYLFGGKEEMDYFNDTYSLDFRVATLKLFTGIWIVNNGVNYQAQNLPPTLTEWLDRL